MPNGNPIARNPLLGKGGEHRRSRSGERQRHRFAVVNALDEWEQDMLAEQKLVSDARLAGKRGQV